MARALLPVIYVAFVGLGLPDTVLGAVWPAVRLELGLRLDAAGPAVLITTTGVAISSLATTRLLERFGTGAVLIASSLLAGTALAMNALAPGWWFMLLAAAVAGLGGGAVDTALNGFVARHYSARHMNWLHGSWGIGATLGPLVAGVAMQQGGSWRHAYGLLAGAELALVLLFFVTRPAWRENPPERPGAAPGAEAPPASLRRTARASVAFFALYGSLEASIGLWSASFLVATRATTPAAAGTAVAGYWGGLTAGRLLLGLRATGGAELRIVRAGLWAVFPAALVVAIPSFPLGVSVAALALLGAALGPIFPTVMHDTAGRFGDALGRRLVGYQIAACSAGIAVLPALVGFTLRSTSMAVLPPILAALAAGVLLLERARRQSAPPVPTR